MPLLLFNFHAYALFTNWKIQIFVFCFCFFWCFFVSYSTNVCVPKMSSPYNQPINIQQTLTRISPDMVRIKAILKTKSIFNTQKDYIK